MLLPYLHEIRQTGLTTQSKPSKVRAEDVLVSSWRQRGGQDETSHALPIGHAGGARRSLSTTYHDAITKAVVTVPISLWFHQPDATAVGSRLPRHCGPSQVAVLCVSCCLVKRDTTWRQRDSRRFLRWTGRSFAGGCRGGRRALQTD
jgi:hypothetical protein